MKPRGRGFSSKDVERFDWGVYPKAEKFLRKQVNTFLKNNPKARKLSAEMGKKTSTDFFYWVDHLVLPRTAKTRKILMDLGFELACRETPVGITVFQHMHSILFPVLLHDSDIVECVLKPEILSNFSRRWNHGVKVQGKKHAAYRYALISKKGKYLLAGCERRGYSGFVLQNEKDILKYNNAFEAFSKRKRNFKTDKEGMVYTEKLVRKHLKKLSPGRVADAFFRGERAYWQSRNKAGQVQKKRQDLLGLGWGNHDHHTFRSSRDNFKRLVKIFEVMGFECRERFYAGEQAGWGAQILEHPGCDIVLFCDTDLMKTDRHADFAHKGFKEKHSLGTVGLWVALHGESILQASMHHLEARFNFPQLKQDLRKKNIRIMAPFSNFPFLKQAFTEGEQWKIEKKRLDLLKRKKLINDNQYTQFLKHGAVGSHMENLQRKQGFKGFNQRSVSAIIKALDPRKKEHHVGA